MRLAACNGYLKIKVSFKSEGPEFGSVANAIEMIC
jgi:hypothetical protein